MNEQVQSEIVRLFDEATTNLKKKDIVRRVQAKVPDASKEHIKQGLKSLQKNEKIALVVGSKKVYKRCWNISKDDSEIKERSQPQDPLPIAEVLRRKRAATKHAQDAAINNEKKEEPVDIDEEIRRLEAELNDEDGDESSEYLSDEEEGDDSEHGDDGVLCLSEVAKDRIAPLPQNLLPTSKSKPMKIDKEGKDDEPKRKRQKTTSNVSDGLRAAVKGVLDGYVARSNEKLPFYCRVCAKQHSNEEEFFQHKKDDFHRAAVEMEKKASYCKLCRKQLTSPVQLKEHLKSKPHKERLQQMQSRQRGGRR